MVNMVIRRISSKDVTDYIIWPHSPQYGTKHLVSEIVFVPHGVTLYASLFSVRRCPHFWKVGGLDI